MYAVNVINRSQNLMTMRRVGRPPTRASLEYSSHTISDNQALIVVPQSAGWQARGTRGTARLVYGGEGGTSQVSQVRKVSTRKPAWNMPSSLPAAQQHSGMYNNDRYSLWSTLHTFFAARELTNERSEDLTSLSPIARSTKYMRLQRHAS